MIFQNGVIRTSLFFSFFRLATTILMNKTRSTASRPPGKPCAAGHTHGPRGGRQGPAAARRRGAARRGERRDNAVRSVCLEKNHRKHHWNMYEPRSKLLSTTLVGEGSFWLSHAGNHVKR